MKVSANMHYTGYSKATEEEGDQLEKLTYLLTRKKRSGVMPVKYLPENWYQKLVRVSCNLESDFFWYQFLVNMSWAPVCGKYVME